MLSDVVVEAQNHVDLVVPTPIARPVASCRGPCRTVQDKATIASDRARRGWPPVTSDTRCAGDERRCGTLFDPSVETSRYRARKKYVTDKSKRCDIVKECSH